MAAFAAVTTKTADAQKAEDRLTLLAAREPPSFDFYMQSNREGVILNRMMFDGLLRANSRTGEVKPGLAAAWERVDDTTLSMKLCEGVTYHAGGAFDASDIVYTLTCNNNPDNAPSGSAAPTG